MQAPPGAPSRETVRRTYLLQRLANREITMEEATELFALMSRQVEDLQKAVLPPPPPPKPREEVVVELTPRSLSSGTVPWDEGILFGGAMSGILAAILKRSLEGSPPAPGTAPTARRPTSPR